MSKTPIGVLISGRGSNLQALIHACAGPAYPAHIVLVISNRKEAYGLVRAKEAGIPALAMHHQAYESREDFDRAMHQELTKAGAKFLCLAGFMRILSPWFVKTWQGRVLNIHPSLLPKFKGGHAVRDALAAGASETGCSVHLVTEELDSGSVIAQARVPILPGDGEETLHARIHAEEHRLYPAALARFLESVDR